MNLCWPLGDFLYFLYFWLSVDFQIMQMIALNLLLGLFSPSSIISPVTVLIAMMDKTLYQVEKVEDRKFVSVTREGRLHGLALWFDATFNPMLYDEDEAAKIQKVCQANLKILDHI